MMETAEKKQHASSTKVKCSHFFPNCKMQMFEITQAQNNGSNKGISNDVSFFNKL